MPRSSSRTTTCVRIIDDSGPEDSVPVRWAAQMLVGGLPGIVICLVIMWMASKPSEQGSGTHLASIVPLLSASGLADSPAFHRLKFDPKPASGQTPQFRLPETAHEGDGRQAREIASPISTPAVDFNSPRTTWKYLSASVRAQVDASLAKRQDWQRVVLHGSGVNHGNASLLNRYHRSVRGLAQGLSYHFVIGNGAGAPDGRIETGSRWSQALPAGAVADSETQDKSISVCLVGDFNEQAPSKAQLEAVHELMDYLSIKLGKVELVAHRAEDGSTSSCLGSKLPAVW